MANNKKKKVFILLLLWKISEKHLENLYYSRENDKDEQHTTEQVKEGKEGKGSSLDLLGRLQTGESVWRILRHLRRNLPHSPAIPFLVTCPKGPMSYSTDTCSAMFITTPSTTVRKWKQSKYSLADSEIWYVHTREYSSAGKR